MPSVVSKQETNTNTELFPLMVTSEQLSLNYMKRLTAVAVSNILYLRNVFTEDCYGHRKLDHLKLRILTEKCSTVGAKQIVHWVKGCFDAMEKKYLKQMTLGIYTDPSEPEELIEAYTFRFTYDSNQFNISLNQSNKREVQLMGESMTSELRTSTVQLLRSLIIMVQSLDRLPADCFLTMKLLYYDDITPEDYEPPGFMPSDKDSFTFKGKPISISAGEVITPFHSLKLKIRTNQEQFQDLVPSQMTDKNHSQLEDEGTPLQISELFHDDRDGPQMVASNVSKENRPIRSGNSGPKGDENNVISKMKDMKVDDNYENRSSDANKRHYEVTQDSVFDGMPVADKRFKASKEEKGVTLKNRRSH